MNLCRYRIEKVYKVQDSVLYISPILLLILQASMKVLALFVAFVTVSNAAFMKVSLYANIQFHHIGTNFFFKLIIVGK